MAAETLRVAIATLIRFTGFAICDGMELTVCGECIPLGAPFICEGDRVSQCTAPA